MGSSNLRAQEMIYFDAFVNSDEGKKLLKDARKHKDENGDMKRTGWYKRMSAHCITGYMERFSDCFPAEDDTQFAFRTLKHPRANLTRFAAETEEERDRRLELAPKRIESMIKGISPNKAGRKKTMTDVAPVAATAPLPATAPVQPTTPVHPSFTMPPPAAMPLPSPFPTPVMSPPVQQAFSVVSGHRIPMTTTRAEKLRQLLPLFQEFFDAMARETGWVGWAVLGGLNVEEKQVEYIHPVTAHNEEGSFEEYLARQLGWSVDRLLGTFDIFLHQLFNPTDGHVSAALRSMPASTDLGMAAHDGRGSTPRANVATPVRLSTAFTPPSASAATQSSPADTSGSRLALDRPTTPPAGTSPGDAEPSVGAHASVTRASPEAPAVPAVVFGGPPVRELTIAPPPGMEGGSTATVVVEPNVKEKPKAKKPKGNKKKPPQGSQPRVRAPAITSEGPGEASQSGTASAAEPETLGKRVRKTTARWNQVSPDMCAAKRLKRPAPQESTELPVAGEGSKSAAPGKKRRMK